MTTVDIIKTMQLAKEHHDAERLPEAKALFEQVVAQQPNHAEAWQMLGIIAGQSRQLELAVGLFANSLQFNPNSPEAHNNLGRALSELEKPVEALEAHRYALKLQPNDARTLEAIGTLLMRMHDVTEAVECFRRAVTLAPDLATSWNGLGSALRAMGKFDEASECFRHALEVNPDVTVSHTLLAYTGGHQPGKPNEVERLRKIVNHPGSSADDRVAAGFALGKLLENAEQFDEAFFYYAGANSLMKEVREKVGERFEPDVFNRDIDHLINVFTPEFFAQRAGWGLESQIPVFIVGMPRSGTTLIEQIAASHPQVFGADELTDIGVLFMALSEGRDIAAGARSWKREAIEAGAQTHLERLRTLGGSAVRVIDKMPDNVLHLGLITLLFPSARIIFSRRDARDNCLSCFFQWFTRANVFAYDLAHCGLRHLGIDRLTDYWLRTLPLRMLEVNYEEMVGDLEGQSRRLIDFLGLPWDPACLSFHQTERMVMTASVWQVRQPIYTRSVGRWWHFEKHLGPLMEVLNGNSEQQAAGSGQ
jgi:tetratricopeptide (TPR) repeat protein